MNSSIERQTQPTVAERPLLRLLERPQRPQRAAVRRAPLPASVWSRLERWAGAILRGSQAIHGE